MATHRFTHLVDRRSRSFASSRSAKREAKPAEKKKSKRKNPDIAGASRFAHLANLGPHEADPLQSFRYLREAKRAATVQASWSTAMARAAAETGGSAAPNDRTAASWDAALRKIGIEPTARATPAGGSRLIKTSRRGQPL